MERSGVRERKGRKMKERKGKGRKGRGGRGTPQVLVYT